MGSENLQDELGHVRAFYKSGETLSYRFRTQQLLALKSALHKYENQIYDALYADLKKSREEAYGSELGLVLSEISYTLKRLEGWMKPVKVATNLVNLPSTTRVYRDPLGVILIIAPFNYPLQLLLEPLVGAIAGGNCAVLKPSELTPATATILQRIISETFPAHYIKVVPGDGAVVIPEMMRSFRFDHILYTGSTTVGKIIYKQAAEHLTPVTLELGGKSPCIVEQDADLQVAARRIAIGKFTNAGQTCIAPDYLLLHSTIKDELLDRLKKTITSFYSADPANSPDFGRIINERHFNRLVGYLSEGEVIYGGHHDVSKLHLAPTILDRVSSESRIMKEEIFGPILPVLSYESREEARQSVDQNPDPLSFYLFTGNKKSEEDWIRHTSFGNGCINNTIWHFTNHDLPFGGVRNSGMGAYHGKYTFDVLTRAKPVMKTPVWFDPSIKYPPLKGKLGFLKKFFN